MTSPPDRLEEIGRLLERRARDPRTHTFAQLADLYRETGQLGRALEVIEAGLKHHPHYVNARLVHARLLRELERPEEAARAFQRVLEIDSENRVAKEGLTGLTEGLIEASGADKEHDEPGRRAAGWLARLDAEWRQESQERERPPSERPAPPPVTRQADPGRLRAHDLETATLAALYMRQGLTEQAIGIYERLLARDPYNARLASALESARQRGKDGTETTPPAVSGPAPDLRLIPEQESAAEPAAPAAASEDEPIGEFLDALLEGRASVDDGNGRRADWPRWLAALGRGDA